MGAQRAWGLSVGHGEGARVPGAPIGAQVSRQEPDAQRWLSQTRPFRLCQGLKTPFMLTINSQSELFPLLIEAEAGAQSGEVHGHELSGSSEVQVVLCLHAVCRVHVTMHFL